MFQGLFKILVSLLLYLSVSAGVAATVGTRGAQEAVYEPNYSFAAYLGSGFYTASGDNTSVAVFNLPIGFNLIENPEGWGLKLNTPVSVGFFDFEVERDLPNLDLPDSIGTFTLLPGLEGIYPVNESWSLHPFADLGLGRNLEAKTTNVIYGFGAKSYYRFKVSDYPFLLANRLYRAGFQNRTLDTSDAFSSFQTGINMQIATGEFFNRPTDIGLYYLNSLYFDNIDVTAIDEQLSDIHMINEIGFTWGASIEKSHALIKQPRMGLGVATDGDIITYRISLGMPFF